MRKYKWLLIVVLIGITVPFIACQYVDKMTEPIMPEPDPEVTEPTPPETVEIDLTDPNALPNRLTVQGATLVSQRRPETSTAETAPSIQADVTGINASPGDTVNLPFEYSGTNTLGGCIVCIVDVPGYYDLPYGGAADALPTAIPVGIPANIGLGSFTVCYSVYDDQGQYGNYLTTVITVAAPEVTEPEPPEVVEIDLTDPNALPNRLTVQGASLVSARLPATSTAATAPRVQADVSDISASPGDTVNLPFEYSGANALAGCIVCIEGVPGYYDLPYGGAADALPTAIPVSISPNIGLGSFTVCYSVYDDQGQYANYLSTVITVMEPEVVEPPTEETPDNQGIGIFDTNVMEGHGLTAEAYIPGGRFEWLPDFTTLTPFHTWTVANIDVPRRDYTQGFPELGIDVLEWFAIRLRGQLKIETDGTYAFVLTSDDGSKLYVDGNLIIDNDGLHGMRARRGSVALAAGYHDVEIQYFQGPRTAIGLQWSWQPPNGIEEIVPGSVLYPPGTATVPIEPVVPEPEPPEITEPVGPTPEGMVLIPAGEFQMGSDSGQPDESPTHAVYVDAFYMDESEVTNAQYAEFLNAKGKHTEDNRIWMFIGAQNDKIEAVSGVYRVKTGYENHPAVFVSWYGAMAYAEWKGKRLPTEAEWEKAARGGLSGQNYPWGNTIDSSQANYNNNIGETTAVGQYPANDYGLNDMAGNVWEWCLDEYDANFYSVSPARNPLSGANSVQWLLDNWTSTSNFRVLRGGSWGDPGTEVRVTRRGGHNPSLIDYRLGFRCVKDASD